MSSLDADFTFGVEIFLLMYLATFSLQAVDDFDFTL